MRLSQEPILAYIRIRTVFLFLVLCWQCMRQCYFPLQLLVMMIIFIAIKPLTYIVLVYQLDFSIYSLDKSSSGRTVPCSSPLCAHNSSCPASSDACPYRVVYLSSNTSSSGYLVEDVLHLTEDNNPSEPADATIPFG